MAGFELRTDVEVVKYPDRYMDHKGESMWNTVMNIINDLTAEENS